MTLLSRLGTVFVITLFPLFAIAQANSEIEVINQIIEETSIEEQLKQSPDELEAQYSQNPFGLPPSKSEQMMGRYRDSYETDPMMNTVRETFGDEYNAEYAESTLSWFDNENTQMVHDYEKEFYTLQGIRKRVVNKYELEQNPPDETRKEIIESLSQAKSATESKVDSYAIIFEGIVTAFAQLSNQQTFSNAQIDTFVDNYRNQIQPQIEQQVINELMIKYYGLGNNQLKEYASYFNTEAGIWLSKTTAASIHDALENGRDRFLNSINDIQ